MGSDTTSIDALLSPAGPLFGRVESRTPLRPDGLGERRVCWFPGDGHGVGREVLLRAVPVSLDVAGRERIAALRSLEHPKIVPLLDWGEYGGATWILTERIRGPRIADTLLSDGAVLALEEFVPVVAQVLMAVGHAHERGCIVGSITARDVHQTEQGGRALAIKIADFGLAALHPRGGLMAVVDSPAADVREIGLLMQELLHGARDAPSRRDDLPAALVALQADMLDPDRTRRPADGNAVVERLIDAVPKALFKLPSARGTGRSDDSTALGRLASTTQRVTPPVLPAPPTEPSVPASTGSLEVVTTRLEAPPRGRWIAASSVVALAIAVIVVAVKLGRDDALPSVATDAGSRTAPAPEPAAEPAAEQAEAVVAASPIAPEPRPSAARRDEPRREVAQDPLPPTEVAAEVPADDVVPDSAPTDDHARRTLAKKKRGREADSGTAPPPTPPPSTPPRSEPASTEPKSKALLVGDDKTKPRSSELLLGDN